MAVPVAPAMLLEFDTSQPIKKPIFEGPSGLMSPYLRLVAATKSRRRALFKFHHANGATPNVPWSNT